MNPSDLIDTYVMAMMGQSMNAFRSVVYKILVGTLDSRIKFVPRPPELANFVRSESSLIRMLGSPRPNLIASNEDSSMVALMSKRWADVAPIEKNISFEDFRRLAKTGRWPVGSVHAPILQTVYPRHPDEADTPKKKAASAIMERLREQRMAEKMAQDGRARIADENAIDYWRKISAMPDIANLTPEQQKMRNDISAELDAHAGID